MGMDALAEEMEQAVAILSHGASTDSRTSKAVIKVPKSHFHDCYGVVVVKKHSMALVFGAVHGSGLVMKKLNKGSPSEQWSAPVPFTISGVHVGASVGAAQSEFVMFLTSPEQVEAFEHHAQVDLELSGVGAADVYDKGAHGGVAGRMDVEIIGKDATTRGRAGVMSTGVVFANAHGVMLSAAVGGSVLSLNEDKLHRAYGESATAKGILHGHIGLKEAHADARMMEIYSLMTNK